MTTLEAAVSHALDDLATQAPTTGLPLDVVSRRHHQRLRHLAVGVTSVAAAGALLAGGVVVMPRLRHSPDVAGSRSLKPVSPDCSPGPRLGLGWANASASASVQRRVLGVAQLGSEWRAIPRDPGLGGAIGPNYVEQLRAARSSTTATFEWDGSPLRPALRLEASVVNTGKGQGDRWQQHSLLASYCDFSPAHLARAPLVTGAEQWTAGDESEFLLRQIVVGSRWTQETVSRRRGDTVVRLTASAWTLDWRSDDGQELPGLATWLSAAAEAAIDKATGRTPAALPSLG